MARPLAISGTFADLKMVKTRSVVQLIIEVPIEQGAAVVEMFGFPQPGAEIAVAVARLSVAAAESEEKPTRRWDALKRAQQAGIRCNEPAFWRFLNEKHRYAVLSADDAAEAVREICGIKSRSELDRDETTWPAWDRLEANYSTWMHHPELA